MREAYPNFSDIPDVQEHDLRERVELLPQQLYRLAGVGLSNFLLEDDAPDEPLLNAHVEFVLQPQQ